MRSAQSFFLSIFISNKQQTADQKQKYIAKERCKITKMLCHQRTNTGTEDEEEDHTIIVQAFIPQLFILALSEAEE